jgi:hypothetical protein
MLLLAYALHSLLCKQWKVMVLKALVWKPSASEFYTLQNSFYKGDLLQYLKLRHNTWIRHRLTDADK